MTKTITVQCEDCQGRGFISRTELVRGKRVECGVHCQACNGNGATSFEFVVCDHCEEPTCCGECQPTPKPATAPVVWMGGVVEAPGFTSESFAAAVQRAMARGYFHLRPGKHGTVLVDTGRDSEYVVTRTGCSCSGHAGHGRCLHRAACIWLHDCAGIDLCRNEVAGFDVQGNPVTAADRAAQLQEVA